MVVLLIFIGSLVAAGAAFAYEKYMQGSIQSANDSLVRAQAAYDPSAIESLLRLNNRLAAAKKLVQNHVSPSSIFVFLENNTLSSVRFTGFAYDMNPNGTATLQLSGEALDFASVALQSDTFSASRALKDVLFSDINTAPSTGRIVFKVSAVVDPSLLSYRNTLSAQTASALPQQTASTTLPAAPAASSSPTAAPSTTASTTQPKTPNPVLSPF
jgi:hypothetical protein